MSRIIRLKLPPARTAEARIEAAWAGHLGRTGTAQLRRALTSLREITDPYR